MRIGQSLRPHTAPRRVRQRRSLQHIVVSLGVAAQFASVYLNTRSRRAIGWIDRRIVGVQRQDYKSLTCNNPLSTGTRSLKTR